METITLSYFILPNNFQSYPPISVTNSEIRRKWEENPDNYDALFQYACSLSRSGGSVEEATAHRREAITHFDYLAHSGHFVRDSLYNLALTEYAIGNFEFARVHCEDLYRQDPDNQQVNLDFDSAQSCHKITIFFSSFNHFTQQVKQLHLGIIYKHENQLQKERQERDTTVGVAVGLGLAAVAVGLGFLLSGPRRK